MFCIPLVFLCLIYISYTAYRATDFYENIKTNKRGWKGTVHTSDAMLGLTPIPNSFGAEIFPIGPDIPMRYDENGFRVTIEDNGTSEHQKPLFLSLGCSFTYGSSTYAKDTYPYLVAQLFKGTSKNAAVSSYGLAQMLINARKLIPTHKPDYVIVQYSPWLVHRAQSPFAPSYYGKVPTPFFYKTDNTFDLHPPVFLTRSFELPVQKYRNTPGGFLDELSFFMNVAFPLFVHDDFNMLMYEIARLVGTVPQPTSAQEELIEYVYKDINNIVKEHGAKLVIVALGNNDKPVKLKSELFPNDAILVNAHEALLQNVALKGIPVNEENYYKEYAHWRGNPPQIVDRHPNEIAHKIIANAIFSIVSKVDK